MPISKNRIEKNIKRIRDDIATACTRSHRSPEEITILPVTKTVELDTIKNLFEVGFTELGESRVQHLIQRAEEVDRYLQRRRSSGEPGEGGEVRWHMVGHLQRNKARGVLGAADVIHSVDSLRLAEEIQLRCERSDKSIDVFLQVNCSEEAQKFGCAMGAGLHLGEMIAGMDNMRLVGLMTMGPLTADPEKARSAFTRLRELFEEMQTARIGEPDFRHLSMGMSQDYTVAVEEGATILRIGTALFE